jgi:hypothetical protein
MTAGIGMAPGGIGFVENGKALVTELAELYKVPETAPEASRQVAASRYGAGARSYRNVFFSF